MGPAIPAKNTQNVTGTVTNAASAVEWATAVPIVSNMLPATASATCAASFSRRLPANEASTSVANPPKAAKVAICRLPMTLSVNANTPGTTIVARTARTAAAGDHFGSQLAIPPGTARGGLSHEAAGPEATSGTTDESTPARARRGAGRDPAPRSSRRAQCRLMLRTSRPRTASPSNVSARRPAPIAPCSVTAKAHLAESAA